MSTPPQMLLWTLVLLSCLAFSKHASAAGRLLDPAKLPQPAQSQIDFQRDIKPLLEDRCYKCHSGDRPKGNFRLTSREMALRGGAEGVDIVISNSAASTLIFYVARLVPEMEMPPEGKGVALSHSEVSMLRAWIDQGVAWEIETNSNATSMQLATTMGYTGVKGDKQKFRELAWQPEGWNGGVEQFTFHQRLDPDTSFSLSGHLLRNDYRLLLEAQRHDLGFARLGWEQYRKWYDDTGGYDPSLGIPALSLNRDLYTDNGRAWVDFGLELPAWPRIVLGYEYQYQNGERSTLQWGPVINAGQIRDVFPASQELSEKTHILKFHLDHELAGVTIEDDFRGEWYQLYGTRVNDASFTPASGQFALTQANDAQKYFQGANTLHLEKQFASWFLASGGYLYSKLNSDASVQVGTANPAGLDPAFVAPGWKAPEIELERESHVFSISSLLGPWQGLSLYGGVQNEWTRQQGIGGADVNIAVPFAPFVFPVEPEQVHSDLDRTVFTQEAGVRFTKIPFTTIFSEARFSQTSEGQFEQEIGGLTPFLRQTDVHQDMKDWRVGFNSSPWRRIELSGHYRNGDDESDYDHLQKAYPGYPGFFLWRDIQSQQAQGRLSLALSSSVKVAASYTWDDSLYKNQTEPLNDPISGLPGGITPGLQIVSGRYQAHTPALTVTLSPWERLFFSGTLSYQNASTVTYLPSVAPYRGDIYTFISSVTFLLNAKTELFAGYTFSEADFAQDGLDTSLPLGIKYHQHLLQAGLKRKFSPHVSGSVQYRYYAYSEPTSGGANDFEAHALFGTVVWALP